MVMGFACFSDFVSFLSFRRFRSFRFGGFVSLFRVLVHAQINTSKCCLHLKIVSDDYKPDDDDESCSSGVDEDELDDEIQSEEDIADITEKVRNNMCILYI